MDFSLFANSKKLLLLEILAMLLIVIMAAFIRYPNLENNPGWYTDEGTLIDIAQHINKGEIQYMAVKDSVLMFGRPPLFVNLLALAFRLFGPGILTLRVVSATLGIVTIVMLYLVIRLCLGHKGIPLAFLSSIMLTVSPMGIFYSRVGYSYIFLSPLILLTVLGAWKYAYSGNRWWLILASLAIGIGSLSDVMIISVLPALLIVVLIRRWRDIFLSLGIALLPFLIYICVMLFIQPQAFLFDLQNIFTRSEGFSLVAIVPAWIINYGLILAYDYWFFPALIGIFLIRPIRFGQLILLFIAVPLFVVGRSFIFAGIGYYYVSPILPLIATGVAAVILYGTPKIITFTNDALTFIVKRLVIKNAHLCEKIYSKVIKTLSIFVVIWLVFVPVSFFFFNTLYQVNTHLENKLDWILVDPVEARHAIDYIDQHTIPDDLVLSSPAIAWALDCQTADFQMSLAYGEIKTVHFPTGIPVERFAYDASLSQAKYVVIDPVWKNFGMTSILEVKQMANEIISNWQMVFSDGDIQIYQNPTRP